MLLKKINFQNVILGKFFFLGINFENIFFEEAIFEKKI